jgi:hypothetical protein
MSGGSAGRRGVGAMVSGVPSAFGRHALALRKGIATGVPGTREIYLLEIQCIKEI